MLLYNPIMPKQKRPQRGPLRGQNKTTIKRQIAQFLATNQPAVLPTKEPTIVASDVKGPTYAEASAGKQMPGVAISDSWSQTTLAEIKRIGIVFAILLVILIGLTIADRKGSLIEKFGNAIANVLQI